MANIKDIAKMAGVSVTTVSRVLNNHPYVSEKKRNAVKSAIEKSNYQ
jgi:DNA-binding LacI/PurR family transcriptional regulator